MEATIEWVSRPKNYTDITTTTAENVAYSVEEGKGSPKYGSDMDVADKTGGPVIPNIGATSHGEPIIPYISCFRAGRPVLPYGATSHGELILPTSEVENVETDHQDEDTRKLTDVGSSSSKQSTEENGMAKHWKVKLTDLAGLSQKTAAHEFYCPNCKTCITEVLIIGSNPPTQPPQPPTPPLHPILCTWCFSILSHAGEWIFRRPAPIEREEEVPIPVPRNAKTLEILKSIAYGGLTEAIASLSIVASAASAGTATLNIFVLALGNLLGGLFIIGHNLWELKANRDSKYEEVLGNKENFIFHAPIAILSFLIFGSVPPLVYGFSFPESEDNDLKIAAVAASSLLCIILLAVGKAYIRTPPKEYIKTVLYYVVVGVGVAGVSYLAGDLIDKLVEKLGWFNSTVAGSLPLPYQTMSAVKPAWGSW